MLENINKTKKYVEFLIDRIKHIKTTGNKSALIDLWKQNNKYSQWQSLGERKFIQSTSKGYSLYWAAKHQGKATILLTFNQNSTNEQFNKFADGWIDILRRRWYG